MPAGKHIINPYITINSVDLSDHIGSVTINESRDEIETTSGGATAHEYIAGLADAEVSLTFHQDYSASSVYHTIRALLGGTTNVVVKPRNATTDTDNPQWTCVAVVTDWTNIDGAVGDLSETSVTWKCNSITEALA